MTEDTNTAASDALAHELIRSAALFTRTAGRVAGSSYSSIAWRVLSDLEHGGTARISELARQQRVTQPSMTSLVQRVEGEGWITRTPDPADGRASLLSITEGGAQALAHYRATAAARFAPKLSRLSEADHAALVRAASLLTELSRVD